MRGARQACTTRWAGDRRIQRASVRAARVSGLEEPRAPASKPLTIHLGASMFMDATKNRPVGRLCWRCGAPGAWRWRPVPALGKSDQWPQASWIQAAHFAGVQDALAGHDEGGGAQVHLVLLRHLPDAAKASCMMRTRRALISSRSRRSWRSPAPIQSSSPSRRQRWRSRRAAPARPCRSGCRRPRWSWGRWRLRSPSWP